MAHEFDQALNFALIEFDGADELRHLDARARQLVARAQPYPLARFSSLLEALGLLGGQFVEFLELVENFQSLLRLGFEILFGQFFLIELDDAANRANVVAQFRGGRQQILDDDRRARNRFQKQKLGALNAL